MIKVIANRNIDLSKPEWEYYLTLEKAFGKNAFIGLFETDKKGQVVAVTPPAGKPSSMVLIFFLLNVQLNQHLRKLTDGLQNLKDLEVRVARIEKEMKEK
nr:hypothetical protein 31 [bacterium]